MTTRAVAEPVLTLQSRDNSTPKNATFMFTSGVQEVDVQQHANEFLSSNVPVVANPRPVALVFQTPDDSRPVNLQFRDSSTPKNATFMFTAMAQPTDTFMETMGQEEIGMIDGFHGRSDQMGNAFCDQKMRGGAY